MPLSHQYLAIDLGAESGRVIAASLDGNNLALTEVHRFRNKPVHLNDGLHWDVLRLWDEIKSGIAAAVKNGVKPEGLGLDTWGVDFGLLDKNGGLISNPYHYRDHRTDGMMEEAFQHMSRREIFANTGIQFMQINTLYQLLAMTVQNSPLYDVAKTFLTIPDLFNYWLSGEITNEFTNSTTTQCFDPRSRDWALPVLHAMQIPAHLFGPVTASGTPVGNLLPAIGEETGAGRVRVILPACHDTGSAVVAVPAKDQNFAWISSGTWSIMGAEVHRPYVDEKALTNNFTNEGGVFGTWRFSKNIMGLWLVQECKRNWANQGEDLSYDQITHLASEAEPFQAVIDPDYSDFLHPGDMSERIRKYCKETNQSVPQTKGEIVRVALESIALKYRWVLERLEEITARQFAPIHIIGGGTKNRLLNQFTANASDRLVIAGPVEATAIGNALMQAIGLGHIDSLAGARALVRASFETEEYHPLQRDGWDEAYQKLLELIS